MRVEVLVTRQGSVAEVIERLIREAVVSVDAALYRLNNPSLVRALEAALRRGVRIRLVLDQGKYEENESTHQMLSRSQIDLRLLQGRRGLNSKMHHKFAVFDDEVALSGSYNWTLESEEQNYDNLVILRGHELVKPFQREFEVLWAEATEAGKS